MYTRAVIKIIGDLRKALKMYDYFLSVEKLKKGKDKFLFEPIQGP